jgi:hypothetical protein
MKHFTSIPDIPVFYGDDILLNYGRNMAFASKVIICPRCLRHRVFIKDSEQDEFHYETQHDPFMIFGEPLEIVNEGDFYHHIQGCETRFSKDGIKKAISEKLIHLAQNMNSISMMETGFSRISIQKSTFFYVVDGLPVSYIAFDPAFTRDDPTRWILKDMYTFPCHRKNGYASKLFEYATKKLRLDLHWLWISFPISNLGKPIVLKYAKDKVTAVAMAYPGTYTVEDLRQKWDEIMRIY